MTKQRPEVHDKDVDGDHVVGRDSEDAGAVLAASGHLEVRLTQDAGADLQRREDGADGAEVAGVHEEWGGNDEVRHEVAVAVELAADDRESRMTVRRGARDRAVDDVGHIGGYVQ